MEQHFPECSPSHRTVISGSLPPTLETTIHVFADASPQAYGAVVQATISTSKPRAAPLKPLSLPRLELMLLHACAHLLYHHLKSLHHFAYGHSAVVDL